MMHYLHEIHEVDFYKTDRGRSSAYNTSEITERVYIKNKFDIRTGVAQSV
jgi:hypothetical protein